MANLHVRVVLILLALGAELLALESANTLKALGDRALVRAALAELRHEASLLHLLFESRLKSVIGFIAFLDCENRHKSLKSVMLPTT